MADPDDENDKAACSIVHNARYSRGKTQKACSAANVRRRGDTHDCTTTHPQRINTTAAAAAGATVRYKIIAPPRLVDPPA